MLRFSSVVFDYVCFFLLGFSFRRSVFPPAYLPGEVHTFAGFVYLLVLIQVFYREKKTKNSNDLILHQMN
ncbi:hypothetical protein Bca4012_082765 [Brassica carinata]